MKMNEAELTLRMAAANRACRDPHFLGYTLLRYRLDKNMTLPELARMLRCRQEALIDLCLYSRPRSVNGDLIEAVSAIADEVRCNPDALHMILEYADRPVCGTSNWIAPVVPMAARSGEEH